MEIRNDPKQIRNTPDSEIKQSDVSTENGHNHNHNHNNKHNKSETDRARYHKNAIAHEAAYRHWLYCIEGIGRKTILVLEALAGSPAEIYRLPEQELKWLLTEKQRYNLTVSRKHWDVEGEYRRLGEQGIGFYYRGHPDYPERFRALPDPPAVLYVKGRLPDPAVFSLAVVGTRRCSGYGSSMARELGTALAAAGVQVISGMARGIDGIGQRAVVDAGGSTFAVLGCGADICYPAENRRLYDRIVDRGGIISEYPPGTQPKAPLFPPRNRIISGLSDVVVVVEAREKSGTMITVDMALEQGREVYAIPGRLIDGSSSGCNRLIKQGAGMIVSVEEFLEELGVSVRESVGVKGEMTGYEAEIDEAEGDEAEGDKTARDEAEGDKTARDEAAGDKTARDEAAGDKTARDETEGDKTARNEAGVKTVDTEEDEAASAEAATTGPVNAMITEQEILSCLESEPQTSAYLAGCYPDMPVNQLMRMLVSLCLQGKIVQMGGGYYCRKRK